MAASAIDKYQRGLEAYTLLGETLGALKFTTEPRRDEYAFRFVFGGDTGRFRCYAQIRVDHEQLLIYVIAPFRSDEAQRLAMSEYLGRVNYGTRIGNFALNFDNGQIRFKSSLNFAECTLDATWIKNALYPALRTMDVYYPGMILVHEGKLSPAAALAEVEEQ